MNQIILIGNLTRDVILRPTANDTFVGSSAIAVSSTRKNEKGEYETDFFDLRFFGNTAESVAKRFRKGDKICVVGRVQIRDYVTKDNIKGRAVEVLVDRVEGLSPRRDENKDDSVTFDDKLSDEPEVDNTTGSNLDALDLADDDTPF